MNYRSEGYYTHTHTPTHTTRMVMRDTGKYVFFSLISNRAIQWWVEEIIIPW